jgi:predicted short-subunit dehydrogenase-like oxidoreductase (DUF2520 family)
MILMNISILGTGNMAWHLARVFEKQEIRVNEIYGREISKAILLADDLYDTQATDELDFSESESDVFCICVSDDAIEEVCSKIILPENAILVHTSGSRPMEVIVKTLEIYHDLKVFAGVFYPIMTFSKGKYISFEEIPICIEAENEETQKKLVELGNIISKEIYLLNSPERAVLHLGAVFSCNFTNHLWALSKEILEAEDLDFELLKPLIAETFKKAMAANHPADVQTGPAIRRDDTVLQEQLSFLADDEDLAKVYKAVSNSIQDWHT